MPVKIRIVFIIRMQFKFLNDFIRIDIDDLLCKNVCSADIRIPSTPPPENEGILQPTFYWIGWMGLDEIRSAN